MKLKEYQQEAVENLLLKTLKLFSYNQSKRLVFKAPTGSGKTIIVASFLKALASSNELDEPFAVIWTAPRDLHFQSKSKLESFYKGSQALKCSCFEDLQGSALQENEILFLNWESINKENNLYIKENESERNLSKVLRNTADRHINIILVIDECHHTATSEISQNLISDIKPRLSIEVSATLPQMENPDESVSIQLEEVKKEGMIKKSVILNQGFQNLLKNKQILSKLSSKSEPFLIHLALRKRDEIKNAFRKEHRHINPLILIQLPDRRSASDHLVKDRVQQILKKDFNISTENKKLAIWLSNEKVNLDNSDITDPNNIIEVLLFKNAPALGWDCPRAHILLLLRDWKNINFSIQTIGRIMRMPEPQIGHYKNDILNNAYVFTNINNIEINEEVARNYITIFKSNRISSYKKLRLISCHSIRFREKTRLAPLFTKLFLEECKKYALKRKLRYKRLNVSSQIISDFKASAVDELLKKKIEGSKTIFLKGFDMQRLFDHWIKASLTPFYPEERSIGRLKESLYHFFSKDLNLHYEESQEKIVQIILDASNTYHFRAVLSSTKDRYKKFTQERQKSVSFDKGWEVPDELFYNSNFKIKNTSRSVLKPFYDKDSFKSESAFVSFLDKQKKVKWWFKNSDRDSLFFAVPYLDQNDTKPFYIDFLVLFQNGSIGLYDTKGALTKHLSGTKIDGLIKYIKDQNRKGKRLTGGLVINTDQRKYEGKWLLFRKNGKALTQSLDNWEDLTL